MDYNIALIEYLRPGAKNLRDFSIAADVHGVQELHWFSSVYDRPSDDELHATSDIIQHAELERARQLALYQMNSRYDQAMESMQEGWPTQEVKTWTQQANEANQYVLWRDGGRVGDSPVNLYFLNTLYQQRQLEGIEESFDELIDKVIYKAVLYSNLTGRLTAIRHGWEKKILESDDIHWLQHNTWSFSL